MSASQLLYCRFCAEQQPNEQIIDLTVLLEIRKDVSSKLSILNIDCIDFSIKTLPEYMCDLCYHSLNAAHEFITKIKIAQNTLINLYSIALKNEISSEDYLRISHAKTCESSALKRENIQVDHSCADISDFTIDSETVLPNHEDEYLVNTTILSWDTYSWRCQYCSCKFDGMNALREHAKASHGVCCGYQCIDCEMILDRFNESVEHARGHNESLNLFCQYCNIKLEHESGDHISLHTSQPNCKHCGELFTDEIVLQKHLTDYQHLKRVKKKNLLKQITAKLKEELSFGIGKVVSDKMTWADYPWVCRYCDTGLSNPDLLRHHVKLIHSKCFGMKCIDCTGKVRVRSFEAFMEHVRRHRPCLKFFCEHCNYKFEDPGERVNHVEAHHQVQCPVCGEPFADHGDLQHHMTTYNSEKPKRNMKKRGPVTIDDLTCGICGKVTKSLNNLRDHKKTHTDRPRNFFCDRCGKAFFTNGALWSHTLIHSTPDPQICKICKKSFLTFERLKKHVKTHNVEKPFLCTECHRCFRLKEQLKGHMITHTDVMPYTCQYCNKSFRFRNVLKNHERKHTGDRPYRCNVCTMEFSCWSNCNKHMERRHGLTLAKTKMTPHGRVSLTSAAKDARLKKLDLDGETKMWTEQILVPRKRGKKRGKEEIACDQKYETREEMVTVKV